MATVLPDKGPVLALDTSGGACSAALFSHGTVTRLVEATRTGHSERLMAMVESLLREAALAFADLERIAVTTGPGSFTGVRIGLAAARGFALATSRPAIGLGTLEVTAAAAARDAGLQPGSRLRILIDARRGEVYWQDFTVGADWLHLAPVTPPAISPLSGLPALASGAARAGSGLSLVAAGAGVTDITGQDAPDAGALAVLGALAALPEPYQPPRPLYLRSPDAKLPGGRPVP
jgi:tRNA threonylcarbamoyladenosine biosynthesis protein TsaB